MKKNAFTLAVISLLLITSSILCNFTGNSASQNEKIETDVASTMIALNVTQTIQALTNQQEKPTQPKPPTIKPSQPKPLPTHTSPPTYTQAPTTPESTDEPPGSISGNLSYPSEYIPALRVVAFNTNGWYYYWVLTVENQGSYKISNLPPGTYHIVAYLLDGTGAAGYTHAVPCGLSVNCTDHSLIDVLVKPDEETTGIDPADWYAPEGSFPPSPVQ